LANRAEIHDRRARVAALVAQGASTAAIVAQLGLANTPAARRAVQRDKEAIRSRWREGVMLAPEDEAELVHAQVTRLEADLSALRDCAGQLEPGTRPYLQTRREIREHEALLFKIRLDLGVLLPAATRRAEQPGDPLLAELEGEALDAYIKELDEKIASLDRLHRRC